MRNRRNQRSLQIFHDITSLCLINQRKKSVFEKTVDIFCLSIADDPVSAIPEYRLKFRFLKIV